MPFWIQVAGFKVISVKLSQLNGEKNNTPVLTADKSLFEEDISNFKNTPLEEAAKTGKKIYYSYQKPEENY